MFDSLFDFVHQITQQNIASFVGVFSATITPLIGACVILYVIYYNELLSNVVYGDHAVAC